MKKSGEIKKGSRVRNSQTGETGTVVQIIFGPKGSHFGYIVLTQSGEKRWVIRKK